MNENTIRKIKWFWAWQDEEEENWLRQMAQEGYHLVTPGLFGRYTFVQSEKQDMVYRLDFITGKRNEKYFQLFRAAGWEHVGELSAWQYWRKPVQEGQVIPEIFTDNESKVQKYRRVLIFTLIFIPILLINIRTLLQSSEVGFYGSFLNFAACLNGVLLVIYLYLVTRILLRIRELRQV